MKIIALTLMFFFSSTSLIAQQLPEWYRVYTFDDSIIEMNTSDVTFWGSGNDRVKPNIGRVKFRWTFDKPQPLSGEPQVKYKSKLEVFEFKCSDNLYRSYEVTLFDAADKVISVEMAKLPSEWRSVASGSMMERFFTPACQLIKVKMNPPVVSNEALELKRVAKLALSFTQRLEQTRDFTPLIKEFFSPDYLGGYIQDKDTNWFLNLNRETAEKASRADLQRFYIAALNAGYLSSLYLISQYPSTSEPVSDEKLMPPDIIRLIKNHPYTKTYKGAANNYDYLADNIDSVERLQSYTDLLEKIADSLRGHVKKVQAEQSNQYQEILDDSSFAMFQPKVRLCNKGCLGLPKGTRLFEVKVPIFHLQLAMLQGEMRIVSAIPYFQ